MRYKVKGTDEATGKPRSVFVEADSAGEAMEQARHDGVRPKSVAADEPEADEQEEEESDAPEYPALARLAGCFRFLAVINLVGAVLSVGGGLIMALERGGGYWLAIGVVASVVGALGAWLFGAASDATDEVREYMTNRR